MKVSSRSIALLIALSIAFATTAQSTSDSLYDIWQNNHLTDSIRVDAFKSYIWNGYLYNQPDSAFVLAEQMIRFSETQHYLQGKAIGLRILGIISRIRGDYSSALDYYDQSFATAEESGSLRDIALALNNTGNIYYEQDNFPKTLEYYRRSLEISEQMGDQQAIALILNNLGNVIVDQGNASVALTYYLRSLKIREDIGHQDGIATSLASIGLMYANQGQYEQAMTYYLRCLKIREELGEMLELAAILNNIGNVSYGKGDYSKALEYYQRGLKVAEEVGAPREIADLLNNIGMAQGDQGHYADALHYFLRSLDIRETLGDRAGIATSLNNIGGVHTRQNHTATAVQFCKKGLALAEEIGHMEQQKEACQCLYANYKSLGRGNEALTYLEQINTIADSINAEETTRRLQQMEFTRQVLADSLANAEEKRLIEEAHREEVRKKNLTRNILLISGVMLLLVSGGLFSRWRYVKRSKAVLQLEKDRSENLLLNILPEEIAEELKEKGRSEARMFDMVSILFSDFKGFTETSAKLSAAELVDEIGHCFEAFDGIVEKYGIEKIKTIGDAYMAAGGLPAPADDAAKRTVMAALDMQAFIVKRKSENEAQGKPAFEMRIGINTGPVVAGIVGVKKFQYDVWGDTVNTASRMESAGDASRVNVSESTYAVLKDDPDFVFEYRGRMEAKGKGEIGMYFVSRR